jgi:NlpC/P60 family
MDFTSSHSNELRTSARPVALVTGSHEQPECASRQPRRRNPLRAVFAAVTCAVTLSTVVAVGGGVVSAAHPQIARNALAAEISSDADLAVAAYDQYIASGDLADYLDYAARRADTARLAARELGYNEFAMIDAWRTTPLDHQRAVLAAMSQVGVPYRRMSSSEGEGFDCSGLTSYAWRQAGYDLARQSGSQIKAAERLTRETAVAGDLVYYPGHVMMYLGVGDAVVHSVQTGRSVEVDLISGGRRNSVRWGDPTH